MNTSETRTFSMFIQDGVRSGQFVGSLFSLLAEVKATLSTAEVLRVTLTDSKRYVIHLLTNKRITTI